MIFNQSVRIIFSIPNPGSNNNTILAAYQKDTGALRIIQSPSDAKPSQNVISGTRNGTPGPQGSAGPQGPKGDTGPQGPAGNDGREVKIFEAKDEVMNPDETLIYNIYTVKPKEPVYFEILAVVQDQNGESLYHHGEFAWYRLDSNSPRMTVLGTPVNVGEIQTLETFHDNNQIKLKVTNTSGDVRATYIKIIVKFFLPELE